MHIGVFSFNTEYTMRIDRLARAAEERGFESLWVPEHTHIPVPLPGEPADPETGMPLGGTKEWFMPEEYRHMSDPFTSLGAAAAVTSTLKLGTCVCLINQHHPLNLAKQVSTLDQISEGRFIFGIGAGWFEVEMNHHGVQLNTRWRELRERLRALRALWQQDKTSFEGEFVRFAESWQYPKPFRPEGPPVVLGTLDTPFARGVVARHGDGWLPLTFDINTTRASIRDVHQRMEALGRDPKALEVSLFFLADELQSADTVKQGLELGAARTILRLPVADEATVLKTLDAYARSLL